MIGLEPNRQYNFRVRAENQYGISEPLQADEPITAKFPFTVPDPPGQPRVIDWDTSNATLVWTRPISDGGSRVQVKDTQTTLKFSKDRKQIVFLRFSSGLQDRVPRPCRRRSMASGERLLGQGHDLHLLQSIERARVRV